MLNIVSVRSFNALQSAAIRAGIALSSTGDYRSLAAQIGLQDQRYDKGYIAGRADYNFYEGSYYSLKPGMAQAATPGSSNHGKGRSRDFAEMLNGDTIPDSLSLSTRQWLAHNAPQFGIYFEVPSEDWHGSDYVGDAITERTLTEEGGGGGGPVIPPFNPQLGQWSLYPLDTGKATIYLKDPHFKSDLVRYLQGVLVRKALAKLTIDGDFGAQTEASVKAFQGVNGLTVDGHVGPKTWAKVDAWALGTLPAH